MPINDLIIVGAGGHARSIIDVVESGSEYRIRGLLDSKKHRGDKVFGYEVLGAENDLNELLPEASFELFIAIGDNFQRHRVYQEINTRIANVKFATLIHSHAYVSQRANVGSGAVVMAGAVVNAGCQIGDGTIINTHATVDHDGRISRFSSLAPNASLGGCVSIGERSAVGLGANIIHNIEIGQDVCVGAGALVLNSVKQNGVVLYGAPSKVVRQRQPDDPYL